MRNYDTIGAETKTLNGDEGLLLPKEFFTQKIVEGVATLVCSAYPKKFILRLSDFFPHVQEPLRRARLSRRRARRFPFAFSCLARIFAPALRPSPPFSPE